jgi:hypothetical protein
MVELFGRIHVHMEQQVHLSWLHVCPKKLWPFSNKYHTICCCVSGILWGIELVEGTDRPCELPRPKFEDIGGSTVGLLLCMLQPIYHRVFLAVLDSGFCVLKAIIDLTKKELIKKGLYWPKQIRGDDIKDRFADKEVGQQKHGKVNWKMFPSMSTA